MSKLHKIPTIQKVTKDSTDFPVPKQLITNEIEAITRRKIQGKNREPFYPDPIYRPPPRPPDNLRPNHPESESDTMPKIDIKFEETHHIKRELFQNFTKGPINLIFKNQKI